MITTAERTMITVEASINAPIEKVWNFWTEPRHIIRWNYASKDWYTPYANNDLRVGGRFMSRMEAKDGSMGFDFNGEYVSVEPFKYIEYVIADGRRVQITFTSDGNETKISETFEAEETNAIELQHDGWQAILDNFKKYVETYSKFEQLHFEILINASPEKVYSTMIDEQKWNVWTSEFNPTSGFKGTWQKGSKMLFVGSDEKGEQGGMVSRISENLPNKFISIEHLGIVHGDREITSGPETEGWTGAMENYSFREINGQTLLSVDMDTNKDFVPYMEDQWPKALIKLKSICESDQVNE